MRDIRYRRCICSGLSPAILLHVMTHYDLCGSNNGNCQKAPAAAGETLASSVINCHSGTSMRMQVAHSEITRWRSHFVPLCSNVGDTAGLPCLASFFFCYLFKRCTCSSSQHVASGNNGYGNDCSARIFTRRLMAACAAQLATFQLHLPAANATRC